MIIRTSYLPFKQGPRRLPGDIENKIRKSQSRAFIAERTIREEWVKARNSEQIEVFKGVGPG